MARRKRYVRGADVVIPECPKHGWKPLLRRTFVLWLQSASKRGRRVVKAAKGESAREFYDRARSVLRSELISGAWESGWMVEEN
jgi:hypothetical protein